MTIGVGERIPSVSIQVWQDGALQTVSSDRFFAGRRVMLVCMPGAFTPTCSREHLPGYVQMSERLRKQGLAVVCMTVNDPFVMWAWAEQLGAIGKVELLPDGNAVLTRAMGLDLDASPFGMGVRCMRAAMVVNDGAVSFMKVEPDPNIVTSTAAAACMQAV
jgi:peroxiredoxin